MSTDRDHITEADVAAGALQFAAGWDAGARRQMRVMSESIAHAIGRYDETIQAMLKQALGVLELDYLDGLNWEDWEPFPDEEWFVEWRKTHPRDHTSPMWQPPKEP